MIKCYQSYQLFVFVVVQPEIQVNRSCCTSRIQLLTSGKVGPVTMGLVLSLHETYFTMCVHRLEFVAGVAIVQSSSIIIHDPKYDRDVSLLIGRSFWVHAQTHSLTFSIPENIIGKQHQQDQAGHNGKQDEPTGTGGTHF